MCWSAEAGLGGFVKSWAPSPKYSTLFRGDGQDHCGKRVSASQESGELSALTLGNRRPSYGCRGH